MKWPRDAWTDALWAAPVKPLELLVGLAFARQAGSRRIVWLSEADTQEATGLSRDAARRARDGLILGGWLVLEERARQQRAARYRMANPTSNKPQSTASRTAETSVSHTPQTTVSRAAGNPDVRETTPEVRETCGADVREKAPRLLVTTSTTTTAEHLWLVVMENLPEHLAASLTRSQRLDDALNRHADEGWTPETLAAAVRGRRWDGAHGGAVVTWLTNLQPTRTAASSTSSRPAWCENPSCDAGTRMRETDDGAPYRCPICHPLAQRKAS